MLAIDLERFVDSRPILARPSSAFERLGRWCRRNRRVAVLGAAVLVLLVTVATTSSVFAVDLARAHRAAVAAYRGECRQSYAAPQRQRGAELAVEQANREVRLVNERSALAVDVLAGLAAQVRSLDDRPDLHDAKRELLQTATAALDALTIEDRIPAARADPGLANAPPPPSRRAKKPRLRAR